MAVIGVGHVGQHHARIYRELPGVELVGVVDIDRAKLQELSKSLGVAAFQDYRDMFGRVDAVSVAVPTVLHAPIARDCLERDLDVLVEKPLAETLEEAEELTDLAKRRGRILQVGHVERFNGAVDRKSTRLNSSHIQKSRMPSSA